ncbi:MAG: MoaD/ThiS family protein [Candidatus Heimdallarchaeaceae archaeon]
MIINIHCFGQIHTLTKERIIEMDVVEGSTIISAIDDFVNRFGETMERLLYREGKIRDFYSIQVDKKHVNNEDFEDYKLQVGQTIAIIPFIAGG